MGCVVDTSVWIDLYQGELIAEALSLEVDFLASAEMGVLDDRPGVYGELAVRAEPDPDELKAQGVRFLDLSEAAVADVVDMAALYRRCGAIDLGVLALAKAENALFLTGDEALRRAAESENVVVHGTEWLLNRMLESGVITTSRITQFRDDMRAAGRRVPLG